MSDVQLVKKKNNSIFIYAIFPFHIVSDKGGDFFDALSPVNLTLANCNEGLNELRSKLNAITDENKKVQKDSGKDSQYVGDLSKYYDFIRRHFGASGSPANLEVYPINTNKLFSHSTGELKNFGAQFDKTKNRYYLGSSDIVLEEMDSIYILLNPIAGLGYFLLGFEISCSDDKDVLVHLSQSDFFRNIGWRKDQKEKKQSKQFQKHSFSLIKSDSQERDYIFSFYNLFTEYFSMFGDNMRFYQDRLTLLYTSCSYEMGNQEQLKLKQLFFEVLRIPDRNAVKFSHELLEPEITKVGMNVITTGLNEGAIVVESVNESTKVKSIANKFLPGFILAINQREILLKTMHRISELNADKLLKMEDFEMEYIEQLKNNLLIIQLKQIFYSVSNFHEVESFFNHLQKVFNVEVMLRENEQSIREIYNLIEAKRNDELEEYRQETEKREKQEAEKEEKRSRIVNTILGAIGCLGLFSFLKDVWPFAQDSQYLILYKFLTISLPIFIMAWLVWYMFRRKK